MPERTEGSIPNSPSPLTRRHFLGRFAAAGAAGLGGSALLAACGGGEDAAEPAVEAPEPNADTAPGAAGTPAGGEYPVVEASTCEGYDTLDEQALTLRQTLNYQDDSPEEGRYCGNCQFKQAYEADAQCLGCQLFLGPVSPGGWCQSWVALTT